MSRIEAQITIRKDDVTEAEHLGDVLGSGSVSSEQKTFQNNGIQVHKVSAGGKSLSQNGEYAARRPEMLSQSSLLKIRAPKKQASPQPILDQLDGIAQIPPKSRARYLRQWTDAIYHGVLSSQGVRNPEFNRLTALAPEDQIRVTKTVLQLAEENAKQGGSLDLSSVFAMQRQGNSYVGIDVGTERPLEPIQALLEARQERLFGPASFKMVDAAGTGEAFVHPLVINAPDAKTVDQIADGLLPIVGKWPSTKIVVRSLAKSVVLTPEGATRPLVDGEADELKRAERGIQPALLLSDLDGTWLSGDPKAEAELAEGIAALKDEYMAKGIQLLHGYVTARPPERIMGRGLPEPDVSLTYNGGEIHYGWALHTDRGEVIDHPQIDDWRAMIRASGFDKQEVLEAIERVRMRPEFKDLDIVPVGDIVGDPSADASTAAIHIGIHTDSITLTDNDDPEMIDYDGEFQAPEQIEAFKWALTAEMEHSINFGMSPVHPFHGKPYLKIDIASPFANKGYATRFIAAHMGVRPYRMIVAGDGGNDIEMMRGKDRRYAIVVGPEGNQLRELIDEVHPMNPHVIARPPEENSSLGVLAGVREALEDMLEHFEHDPHA